MPIQIAKTIPTDAQNSLYHHHREPLQKKHGVKIFFPKSLVRGDKQDMIIKGGVIGTTIAEREIDRILIGWRQEFEAFKQRQAYRKAQRRIAATEQSAYFPTIAETCATNTKNTSKSKSNNPFAILEQLHDTPDEPDVKPTASAPKPKTLSGWATVAAKPAVKPNETPNPPKQPKDFDWAQQATDYESDDDYDDEVAMAQLDNWRLNDRLDLSNVSWADLA